MADSRDIGIRVGAAGNQAATVLAGLVQGGWVDKGHIGSEYARLTRGFAQVMNDVQQELMTGATPPPAAQPLDDGAQQLIESAFAGTTAVATPAVAQPAAPVAAAPVAPVAAVATAGAPGYNVVFSGSSRPLKIAEHPELDAWLLAQTAALGVTEVWDNRGKSNYIAAINERKAKTPPPFRSATEGVDKGFWPPEELWPPS